MDPVSTSPASMTSSVLAAGVPGLAVVYVVLAAVATVLQLRYAARHHHTLADSRADVGSEDYRPSVDVVVPCFNEDPAVLDRCLSSLVGQRYHGELRVWIVDDGSSSRAVLEPVYDRFTARDGWNLITQPHNQGKRLAQDAAVRSSQGELVINVDSDTVVSKDGIRHIAALFCDPRVGVATGNVRASNRNVNALARLIDVRYRLLFEIERAAQSLHHSVLCCSGPFAAYRRSAILGVWPRYLTQEFRGVRCTSGEDLHLTLLVLTSGHRSLFEPRAEAVTMVPSRLKDYARQQLRWNRSFYRELSWIRPLLGKHPAYLTLDVTARLWLPLLLPLTLVLALVAATLDSRTLLWQGGLLAGMMTIHVALCAWQTRQPRLTLLYGVLYLALLIPIRLYALCTLSNPSWGTRRFEQGRIRRAVMNPAQRRNRGPGIQVDRTDVVHGSTQLPESAAEARRME